MENKDVMIKAQRDKVLRFKATRDGVDNFMVTIQKMLDEENKNLHTVFDDYASYCTFRDLSDKRHRQAPLLICNRIGNNAPCDMDNCPKFM